MTSLDRLGTFINSLGGGGGAANSTLTSADIDEAQVSGLDRCSAATSIYNSLCAGSDGNARTGSPAIDYCVPFGCGYPR